MVELKLRSTVFEEGGTIPSKYTCEGLDVNPPLEIAGVPKNAKSIVLIVDDPDAPSKVWDHWVMWNIPPDTKKIEEDSVPEGAVQGVNDFKRREYGGPCPPPGPPHRYMFKLYALDTVLDLAPSSTKKDVEKAMSGNILAQTTLVGLYQRS
ncbi:MAG: YbhB/YbcL family Raf kinase inhibitor-like protein [Methanosarcinales archaeon]